MKVFREVAWPYLYATVLVTRLKIIDGVSFAAIYFVIGISFHLLFCLSVCLSDCLSAGLTVYRCIYQKVWILADMSIF